jgi:hypothetical protein
MLGSVYDAEHPVAVRVQLPAVRLDEALERPLVARASRAQQLALPGRRAARGSPHASTIRPDGARGLIAAMR